MNFETQVLREQSIIFNDLTGMDEKLFFFYDESNNFRKFRFKNGKLNNPINSNFVLGGVVHEENAIDFDYYKLLSDLNLQKSTNELKLRSIANGNFLECLNSKKLNIFLDWLQKSDLYIHYFALNLFYFSIVDIVDSAVVNSKAGDQLGIQFVNIMKSNLYSIAKRNDEYFISLLVSYNYPNLNKEVIEDFINDIINYIRGYEDEEDLHLGLVSLRQILKESISKNELAFLENNENHILIDNFMHFYLEPIYMFINSKHEFDEESTIFALIDNLNITYKGKKINNYRQLNSKDSKLIQISDVVVGLIAKFTDFITSTGIDDLKESVCKFEKLPKDNFDKLVALINRSNRYNKGFLHFSMSNEDRIKMECIGC